MRVLRPLGWRERLWCLFLPARCLCCGRAVRPERLFCPGCVPALPKEPLSREFPLPGGGFLAVAACFPYEKGFRRTLHRLKFQEERALARPLGTLMAEAASSLGEELDGVTWVPMSPQKLRRRGYNQSELLAKAVAKELGLPAWDLLEQVRETDTQHNLTRAQRADNVRGAYRAKGAALGKRVLLVDDIVTTGATLRACAQGLYGAGAQKVCAVCAANTAFSRREELPPAEPEEDM